MPSQPEDSSATEGDQNPLPDLNEEVAAAFGAVTHIEIPKPVESSEDEDAYEAANEDQGTQRP